MDARRWERIKRAFSSVIAHGPDRALDALLEECDGDEELGRELRPLVEEHFRLLNADRTTVPTDGSTAELPALVAGRFRILARLGSGSFGDVYRVKDEVAGGEEVALKILRSSDPVALQ